MIRITDMSDKTKIIRGKDMDDQDLDQNYFSIWIIRTTDIAKLQLQLQLKL